jgi:formylglycine-generating enzyme required for sulfatase activity
MIGVVAGVFALCVAAPEARSEAPANSRGLVITAAQFRAAYNQHAAKSGGPLLPPFERIPEAPSQQLQSIPNEHISVTLTTSGTDDVVQAVVLVLGSDGTEKGKKVQTGALIWGLGTSCSLGRDELKEIMSAMFKDAETRGPIWGGGSTLFGCIFQWSHTPNSPWFVRVDPQPGNWPICLGANVLGHTHIEPKSSLTFVAVPPGKFRYQREDDKAMSGFDLGRTEVTVEAYARCVRAGACKAPLVDYSGLSRHYKPASCNWGTKRTNHPINCVDWFQAEAFCSWIGGRLPTSEEWEYAASGGEGRVFPWGYEEPDSTRVQWHADGTAAVGTHPRGDSRWGLQDMAGNVGEWTSGDVGANSKEIRGGWWALSDDKLASVPLGTSYRSSYDPKAGHAFFGFRCRL